MRNKERTRSPVFDMAPFALPSSFWNPSYTRGSPWLEHLPFCFWAVEAGRPASVVAAGTEEGVAYFSLCEAVSRLGLDTRCLLLSVDGDPALKLVTHNQERFAAFSRIEPVGADSAAGQAEAGIDLLVLNGSSVGDGTGFTAQLDAWLPKLSPRAVVLAPGIGAQSPDHVNEDWDAIRKQRLHFSFQHGGGLGVVGVGDALPELFEHLFTLPDRRHAGLVRAMFARLGRAVVETHRHAVAKRRLQRSDLCRAELELELRRRQESESALRSHAQRLEAELGRRQELELELRGQRRELELALRRQEQRLVLAAEHAERVADAVGIMKRDQEETKLLLAASADKVSLLEADRNVLARERKRDGERIREIKGEVAAFKKQIERERISHRRVKAELEASLQAILDSRSWTVTAPLRRIARAKRSS